MMKYSIFVLLLIALCAKGALVPLEPSEDYLHNLVVDEDEPDQYKVFWKFDNESIQFELHCKSKGWVGLGLSPNGGMAGADIAIGWVDNSGKPFVKDCFATSKSRPLVDKQQDWELLDGAEVNGYTILKIKRKLNTCDVKEDREIVIGTTFMIFAWNDKDPVGNNWAYHGDNRKAQSALLLNYATEDVEKQNELPDDVISVDLRASNVRVGVQSTYYFCDLFELPKFQQDMHLVAYEMLINKERKKYMHHLLGYECDEGFVPPEPLARECGNVRLPEVFPKNCQNQLVIGWGVGGAYRRNFPKVAGYRFKATNETRYLFFEMHYDNFNLDSDVVDDTGVRLFLSPTLREHDLGVVTLGTNQLPIAPKSKSVSYSTICYPECTDKYIPDDGIYAVTGFLHTHLAGRGIRTSLVRDGNVISNLFDDPNYDANYQNPSEIPPTLLKKGDVLITECRYNTEDRDRLTTFGFGTYDEMCINFLYYYPQIPKFQSCNSEIRVQDLFDFYHTLIDDKSVPIDNFNASSIYEWVYTMEYKLKEVDFTSATVRKFETFVSNRDKMTIYCGAPFSGKNVLYRDSVNFFKPKENLVKKVNNCPKK